MPEKPSGNADEAAERRETLVAKVLQERTFIRVTRPEELMQFRTKLVDALLDLAPASAHEQLQDLVSGGLDRLLDALVGDARALEAQAMWSRRLDLQMVRMEHELLETKIRLRSLEVQVAGGEPARDAEVIDLSLRLVQLTKRLRNFATD